MAELINTTDELDVHYLKVVAAIHLDSFVTANAAAVGTNPAATSNPAWSGRSLATAAAELGVTELELVTEARRQAAAALERRATDRGRELVAAVIAKLDDWLGR